MSPTFLIFDDKKAVQINHISTMRALDEHDYDTRTGELHTGIPEDAMTRVDTIGGGYFYTALPFDDVVEQLVMATSPFTGDNRG